MTDHAILEPPGPRELILGLSWGILDPADVVAWAGRQVLRYEAPLSPLVEISQGSGLSGYDLIRLLDRLPWDRPTDQVDDDQNLGVAAVLLIDRGGALEPTLTQLVDYYFGGGPPHRRARIASIWDLARRNSEEALRELRDFLGQFIEVGRVLVARIAEALS